MNLDLPILQTLAHRLDDGEIDAQGYLVEVAQLLTRLLGCSRAGLWTFIDTDRGPALRCMAMVDSQHRPVDPPTDMLSDEHALYFDTLLNEGCVVADDARSHPATVAFVDEYLAPNDVYSLLDVCHSVNGKLFGVVSCEQTGAPVTWSARQLQIVRQVVARAGLTLRRASLALGVVYRRPRHGRPWNDTDWG